MANGKVKGNGFEREIASKLSKYLTENKEDYAIWRSSSSGAHSTILSKLNKNSEYVKKHSGDLVQTIDPGVYSNLDNFFKKYFVETKFYKQIELFPPFDKFLISFFDQLIEEKNISNKLIFFILKRNYKSELLITDDIILDCNLYLTIFYKEIKFNVYLFEDFLKI